MLLGIIIALALVLAVAATPLLLPPLRYVQESQQSTGSKVQVADLLQGGGGAFQSFSIQLCTAC